MKLENNVEPGSIIVRSKYNNYTWKYMFTVIVNTIMSKLYTFTRLIGFRVMQERVDVVLRRGHTVYAHYNPIAHLTSDQVHTLRKLADSCEGVYDWIVAVNLVTGKPMFKHTDSVTNFTKQLKSTTHYKLDR